MHAIKRTRKPQSFAARALKRVRTTSDCDATDIDTQFILPTSNICERMFSKAGSALSDSRKRILP